MRVAIPLRLFVIFTAFCAIAGFARANDLPTEPTTLSARVTQKLKDAGHRMLEETTAVTESALSMLGIQYKFGGNSPDSGFDCSGLVRYVFQNVTGIALPHNAAEQSKVGREISLEELRPGDLVFFNTRKFAFSHVGIYLGENKFVHAPRKGKPVQIMDFNNPYWQKAYDGARRIIESAPSVFLGSANASSNAILSPAPALTANQAADIVAPLATPERGN